MNTHSYLIYYENRPLRIAFLIDPIKDLHWIDRIISFNREKWGGRYNPIIFSDGKKITNYWWQFLLNYDPDIIVSIPELDARLKKKLEETIDPISVNVLHNNYIRLDNDPLSIFPSKEKLSILAKSYYEKNLSIIAFEVTESAPKVITDFISRNFGIIKKDKELTIDEKRFLDKQSRIIYQISDYKSLKNALLDLGGKNPSRTFLSQLCTIPNSYKNETESNFNRKFAIVIGDSVDDIVCNWNRILFVPEYSRYDITSIWVPTELVDNSEIKEGLSSLIKNFGSRLSNDNNSIFCVSYSLSNNEIKKFSEEISKEISLYVHYKKYSDIAHDENLILKPFKSFSLSKEMDFYTAHSNEENMLLSEPFIEKGVRGDQVWICDYNIQYRPENFTNILGKLYWWQLPRKHQLLSNLQFFNKASRINQFGTFSVLQRRQTFLNKDKSKQTIKIPSDETLFYNLICRDNANFSSAFREIQLSDKGEYLTGILKLFPNLYTAYCIFKHNYWRKIFTLMSNRNDEKDNKKLEEIKNKLIKQKHRDFQRNEQDREWLAYFILNESKKYLKHEIEFRYKDFVDEGKIETDYYNRDENNNIPFDEGGLKDAISHLVDWNVFLIGLKPKCPLCGYKIWYQINDLGQRNTCRGCGYEYSIDIEENWYYRLNSLVRAGAIDHGIIPIILILGQLLSEVKSSFIYMPSARLISQNRHLKEMEVDLMCIQDGSFDIYEIKQNAKLFTENDFNKMAHLGKIIKANRILFSSMDTNPDNFVKKNIEKMNKDLKRFNIIASWYSIYEDSLKPSPVR